MRSKLARELEVGDTFYRSFNPVGLPGRDQIHTVQRVQFVPIRDFFGGLLDTVQMDAYNHLLGPAKLTLSADEEVWIVEGSEAMPPAAGPSGDSRSSGGRWGRRWRS